MKAFDLTLTALLALGSEPLLGRGGVHGGWEILSPGKKQEGDPRGFWEQEFQTYRHREEGGASQFNVKRDQDEAEST